MAANPDKIKLVVRYGPFHDGADYFVKILEAARKQGKCAILVLGSFENIIAWSFTNLTGLQLLLRGSSGWTYSEQKKV